MRFRLFCAAVLCAAAALPAGAAAPLDRIVAVVNEDVVLQSELDQAMQASRKQIADRGIAAPPEDALRGQVLDHLILIRVQTERAQESGIRVDDRELNEVLTSVAAQNRLSLQQFAEAVKKEGLDYLAVREQIRDEVLINRLRAREIDSRVLVTEQDVDLYLANQSRLDQTEYRVSHILVAVPDGATSQVRAKARAKAESVLKRIKAGEDFAQLAIANSDGQQALQGGDLDWRAGGNLPELFANAVQGMKKGDVSGLLENASGFHILRLTDLRGGEEKKTVTETHAQHILLTPNAIRDEEQTKSQARQVFERVQKGEAFGELAKKLSDDPGSKNGGGDLGWQPPGVFAPEFEKAIEALQPGQVSPPFRTQFGWHVAKVIERRTRDTTDESRRARARAAIQNRKAAEEYDMWLRRLRAEAYVEYRLKSDDKAAAKPAA
ncbi:MAG TPA: peptidylprolyl isomerase [Candidatus Binatia bacterium]|nr:peptidylprolyl isomerase [Candidatus Binatia bacterium]